MKKFIPIFVLIILVYAWFFLLRTPPGATKKQVLGANTNAVLYIEPDAGKTPILDKINLAKYEIDIEVYLLSDKDIISGLESAKNRGVAVNIILEEHPFGGGKLNSVTKKELENHKIAVMWSNPAFALTHEKSIVIDDSIAFVLSQNLTESSFTKNREYDVLDTNHDDIKEIKNIFLSDWNRSNFTPSDTDLLVSPDNSRVVLENLINSAQKEIDIEAEDIDDSEIISLLDAKAKNIKVKIITPTLKQISSNKKALDELSTNNVEVKTLANPYMHAKLILVDNSKAYVGSINLSSQSLDSNRELGIILSQTDIINLLSQTFASDWSR